MTGNSWHGEVINYPFKNIVLGNKNQSHDPPLSEYWFSHHERKNQFFFQHGLYKPDILIKPADQGWFQLWDQIQATVL